MLKKNGLQFLMVFQDRGPSMSFFENTMKSHEMVTSPAALVDRLREEVPACHDEPCVFTVR